MDYVVTTRKRKLRPRLELVMIASCHHPCRIVKFGILENDENNGAQRGAFTFKFCVVLSPEMRFG